MNKKLLLLCILSLVGNRILAQQDAQYSQYMFTMLTVNPAYAGSRDVLSITGLYRNQWVGLEGAPVTQTLTADMPVHKEKMGLGLSVFNDKVGILTTRSISGVYAYRIRLTKGTLAAGIQGGVVYFSGDYSQIRFNPTGTTDPASVTDYVRYAPVVGTGVYYSTDRLYLGISVPNLWRYTLTDSRLMTADTQASRYRHLFAMAGYVFPLTASVVWKPSTLVKVVKGAPFSVDINSNFWFYDRFAVGASYRTGHSVLGMAEWQVTPVFRIGYAYDYSLNALRPYNAGTHELMLRYEHAFSKAKVLSPRYF